MKPETVTFHTVVEIADADGRAIVEGSVLKHITEGEIGIVTRIIRKGDMVCSLVPPCIGDLHISTRDNCTRATNKYANWRHVPHEEQTYEQRLHSWFYLKKPTTCISERTPKDEAKCIDGLMHLLPDGLVDWENGPWPDTIEEALRFLVKHLSSSVPSVSSVVQS